MRTVCFYCSIIVFNFIQIAVLSEVQLSVRVFSFAYDVFFLISSFCDCITERSLLKRLFTFGLARWNSLWKWFQVLSSGFGLLLLEVAFSFCLLVWMWCLAFSYDSLETVSWVQLLDVIAVFIRWPESLLVAYKTEIILAIDKFRAYQIA